MKRQFITNSKREKIAVIIPINAYEDLLYKRHLSLELTDDYKIMIDEMLNEEENGTADHVSFESIKSRFLKA